MQCNVMECMNVCTHACTYVRTYVCTYVCIYTYVCMYVRTYVHMYVRMHACMYVRTHACTYVPTYVRTYVHVRMRVLASFNSCRREHGRPKQDPAGLGSAARGVNRLFCTGINEARGSQNPGSDPTNIGKRWRTVYVRYCLL